MDPLANTLKNQKIFASWSGGKDSCLALYKAIQGGATPGRLLTMFVEDGERSRSHGLGRQVIEAQAAALNLPLLIRGAAWDKYEEVFTQALQELKQNGITNGIFGDIDLEPHRQWVERVCQSAGLAAHLPLWQRPRRELLAEFMAAGFSATIIAKKDALLPDEFLGRTINPETIADLEKAGVDACGEQGEYHTVVTSGPLFDRPIPLHSKGIVSHDGYSFLEMVLK